MNLEGMGSQEVLDIFAPGESQEVTQGRTVMVAWNQKFNYILASGTDQGEVIIWDLKHNKQIQNFSVASGDQTAQDIVLSWNTE